MARSCVSKALRSALREVLKGCEDGREDMCGEASSAVAMPVSQSTSVP